MRALLLLVVVSALTGCAQKRQVEVTRPERGTIVASFREPAQTRLKDTWPVTMPVSGRIGRVNLEPGDPVDEGQVLVAFDREPLQQAVAEAAAHLAQLEGALPQEREQAEAAVAAARARLEQLQEGARTQELDQAQAAVKAAQADAEYARAELQRLQNLREQEAASKQQLQAAQRAAAQAEAQLQRAQSQLALLREGARAQEIQQAEAALQEAQAAARMLAEDGPREKQIAAARARLARAKHELDLARIVSPIDGVVLARHEVGNRTVAAGTPLLLLGSLEDLEVEADVLSADALRLAPGSNVDLELGVDDTVLPGRVRRISPLAFTELSSLGVEQQRVKVLVAFDKRDDRLGVGYRLHARFITGREEDALIVPRFSVLQDPDGSYYVFRIADGVLRKQPVELGLTNDLEMQVLDGLQPDTPIAATPEAVWEDGDEVERKE